MGAIYLGQGIRGQTNSRRYACPVPQGVRAAGGGRARATMTKIRSQTAWVIVFVKKKGPALGDQHRPAAVRSARLNRNDRLDFTRLRINDHELILDEEVVAAAGVFSAVRYDEVIEAAILRNDSHDLFRQHVPPHTRKPSRSSGMTSASGL